MCRKKIDGGWADKDGKKIITEIDITPTPGGAIEYPELCAHL
jgi:hypothetical protein